MGGLNQHVLLPHGLFDYGCPFCNTPHFKREALELHMRCHVGQVSYVVQAISGFNFRSVRRFQAAMLKNCNIVFALELPQSPRVPLHCTVPHNCPALPIEVPPPRKCCHHTTQHNSVFLDFNDAVINGAQYYIQQQ